MWTLELAWSDSAKEEAEVNQGNTEGWGQRRRTAFWPWEWHMWVSEAGRNGAAEIRAVCYNSPNLAQQIIQLLSQIREVSSLYLGLQRSSPGLNLSLGCLLIPFRLTESC